METASNARRRHSRLFAAAVVLAILAVLHAPALQAQRLYRWVDAEGAVHYSDTLPASAVDQGHTELNPEGLRVELVPPPPTPEERAAAQALARQEAEEARALERQRARDRELLASFQVAEDVLLARDGRIAAVEARAQILRDQIRLDQDALREAHAEAPAESGDAEATRAQQARLIEIERRILARYAAMIELEGKKDAVFAEFASILARFRALKGLEPDPAATAQRPAPPNLAHCPDSNTCLDWWERARAYVRQGFGEPDPISSVDLIVSTQTNPRERLVLTLARLPDPRKQGVALYLDLYCKNRLTTDTTCRNPEAIAVRDGLRAALL
ncbi:MAG: DUF4124 domain-containing protein, partial [Chromatiaceae bacterium]|nr:DUF4124 domain-containing protein [Chromatiaceae bacterium]